MVFGGALLGEKSKIGRGRMSSSNRMSSDSSTSSSNTSCITSVLRRGGRRGGGRLSWGIDETLCLLLICLLAERRAITNILTISSR
jgi:hypothetical protein